MKKHVNLMMLWAVLFIGYDWSYHRYSAGVDVPVINLENVIEIGGAAWYDCSHINLGFSTSLNLLGIWAEEKPKLSIGITYKQNAFMKMSFGGIYVGKRF